MGLSWAKPSPMQNLLKRLFKSLLVILFAIPFMAPAAYAQIEPRVLIQTSMGDITVELAQSKAPKTVANFLAYANSKFYDGTIFHRVIDGFMIQGGGFTANLTKKTTKPPIALAAATGLKNDRGTLAMARTANPNSATAQFFINGVDNAMLNAPKPDGHGYAVFGKVIAGMDVVDKIQKVATGNQSMYENVPTKPITILSINLLK